MPGPAGPEFESGGGFDYHCGVYPPQQNHRPWKMNIQSLKAELSKIERRRARLEKQIKSRTSRQYAALPARVGLKSIDALILNLAPFASPRLRSRLGGN